MDTGSTWFPRALPLRRLRFRLELLSVSCESIRGGLLTSIESPVTEIGEGCPFFFPPSADATSTGAFNVAISFCSEKENRIQKVCVVENMKKERNELVN